jgi:hypothetical protein
MGMKKITEIMINEYKIKGIDMMGYRMNKNEASYHHLIIPRRKGGEESIENGAILNRKTSHPYLHIIEGIDREIFEYITIKMIEEKYIGRIDKRSIEEIDKVLDLFEREHSGKRTSKGKVLIKPEFIYERKIFTK